MAYSFLARLMFLKENESKCFQWLELVISYTVFRGIRPGRAAPVHNTVLMLLF